jgi:EmrB/QacA subfamily drug resistance transporter
MVDRARLIPVIVASPMLLQNLDTSVMATALPSIATSLHVLPLSLNLAITSYLLSLAVFLPASAWLADRFGMRKIFCWAIGLFTLGSALCGFADSLAALVAYRILQGMGGAMMVPVGRLILLRSIPAAQMVSAMVWFTVPGVFGRVAGPLLGGLIVTIASWRWIFLINVPVGVLGIAMAMRYIDESPERIREPFDIKGFILLSIGLVGFVSALDTIGRDFLPVWFTWAATALGVVATYGYWLYSRRIGNPVIDLTVLRFTAFRAATIGGMPLRIAVGASPFLLPLMLQLGFGLSPLESGTLTVASALGSLSVRAILERVIQRVGFRGVLIGATALTGFFYCAYGLFRPTTPHWMIFVVLLLGGIFNALGMVTLNTLGYSDVPAPKMSHATAMASMARQLSLSLGVAVGASLVALIARWHGGSPGQLTAADFSPVFFVVGILTWISTPYFFKLSPDEGEEMRAAPRGR